MFYPATIRCVMQIVSKKKDEKMNYCARMLGISFLCTMLTINGSTNTSPYFSIRSQGCDIVQEIAGLTNHVNLFGVDRFYGTAAVGVKYSKSFHSQRIAQCLFGNDLLGCDSQCRAIKISGSAVEGRNSNKDWLADYFGLPRDYQSTITFCPRIENVITNLTAYFGLDNWYEGLFARVYAPLAYTKWNLNYAEDINSRGGLNHHPGYFNGRVTLGAPETQNIRVPATGTLQYTVNRSTYPNAYGVARTSLVDSFTDFACNKAVPSLGSGTETVGLPQLVSDGQTTPTVNTTLANATFPPVTFNPLCFARFAGTPCDNTTKIGFADLYFTIGYNYKHTDDSHFGVGLRVIAPTGNAPDSEYVFEPILGNGNHWGVGVALSAHKVLWESDNEKEAWTFFMDSNITHLLSTTQKRTFDLKNKPNSRYMLAQKMKSTVNNLTGNLTGGSSITTGFSAPEAQFDNAFTPIANLTTLDAKVSVGVQTDTVFMFSYRHGDFICDVGYNLWTRSCEKIKLKCKTDAPFDNGTTWVLKGDAQVYGYGAATVSAATMNTPQISVDTPLGIALSPSQSTATIHGGANGYTSSSTTSGSLTLQPVQNPGINNPYYAFNSADVASNPVQIINNNPNLPATANPSATSITTQVQTSVQPVFLTANDIDLDGARTKGMSHKLFVNMAYTWVAHAESWDPYIGGGLEGEFHTQSSLPCTTSSSNKAACSKCKSCGISQWALWIKGGISFH